MVQNNDIKNSVSYYLYLYINLNPYKLVSAIAKGGGGWWGVGGGELNVL